MNDGTKGFLTVFAVFYVMIISILYLFDVIKFNTTAFLISSVIIYIIIEIIYIKNVRRNIKFSDNITDNFGFLVLSAFLSLFSYPVLLLGKCIIDLLILIYENIKVNPQDWIEAFKFIGLIVLGIGAFVGVKYLIYIVFIKSKKIKKASKKKRK